MQKDEGRFAAQLAAYKQAIDAAIAAYVRHAQKNTREQYGEYPGVVTGEFLDLLTRGGKRIRGALVMCGYEMLGGTNQAMVVRAATAIEMLHTAMLIIDDIQDQDTMRRGKPAVHVALAEYHTRLGMQGTPTTTGISLALDASLVGSHAAQVLLTQLDVDPELRLKIISIVNQTIVLTLHGQTYDVINAGLQQPKPADKARATEWKSAHYTFLNPLCVGMVLAGAGCEDTDAIRDYALGTGIAFQLADDIMDGDVPPAAVSHTRKLAAQHVQKALKAIQNPPDHWDPACVAFLRELSQYAMQRQE